MLAIIDFLYCGEANVFQENLDSFLAIAEQLQLKGLMGKTEEKLGDVVEERPSVAKKTKLLTLYDENKSRTIPNINRSNRAMISE